MLKHKSYSNGLNLIVCEGGAISCSFSIMIGTGSVNETDKTNGISHYIEHMNFKGNKLYGSYEITDIMDSIGASYNAYTSVESTCFYAQTIVESLEEAFKIMAYSAFSSLYSEEEAEKEKGVIIEEINMSEDSPDDVCYDLMMKAYYGEDGYGRTILGPSENVRNFTQLDVKNYLNDFYVSENVVISFAGNITLEKADAFIRKYVLPKTKQNRKEIIDYINNEFGDIFESVFLEHFKKKYPQLDGIDAWALLHLAINSAKYSYEDGKKDYSEICHQKLNLALSLCFERIIKERIALGENIDSIKQEWLEFKNLCAFKSEKEKNNELAHVQVLLSLKGHITSQEFNNKEFRDYVRKNLK